MGFPGTACALIKNRRSYTFSSPTEAKNHTCEGVARGLRFDRKARATSEQNEQRMGIKSPGGGERYEEIDSMIDNCNNIK